jgi:hypothetical protein
MDVIEAAVRQQLRVAHRYEIPGSYPRVMTVPGS